MILAYLAIVVAVSYVIAMTCESFDAGSRYLGRYYQFPPGIRGATINAIGSSLPELFTTAVFLFFYVKKSGLSAGIATCVGSALFNSVVIPGLCIIAVLWKGVTIKGVHQKVTRVVVDRGSFLRDAIFFILAELMLILMLNRSSLGWWMGAGLIGLYVVYVYYIYLEVMRNRRKGCKEESGDEEDEDDEDKRPSRLRQILTFDFHGLLFNYGALSPKRAWALLGVSVLFIGGACHVLAEMVQSISVALQIPNFFVAVILAAAATSVPDTIISIKDATSGDYEDAIANAFGSNVFDITICIGLPILLYGLLFGPVPLVLPGMSATAQMAPVQELQVILVVITLLTVGMALGGNWKKTELEFGKFKAMILFGFYVVYLVYVYGRIAKWPWLEQFAKFLTFS